MFCGFSGNRDRLKNPTISRHFAGSRMENILFLQENNVLQKPTVKGLNHWIKLSLVLVLMVSLAACTLLGAQTSQSPTPHIGKSTLKPVTLESKKVLAGQTIYVPVYSYIYHYDTQNQVINLATTLSIRNTDLKHPMIIMVMLCWVV